MTASNLPYYANMVVIAIILAILATAWVVVLTTGENGGKLYAGAPAGVAALSGLLLVFFYYNAVLPLEVSFWGSAILAALGLWGAWVDYTHLTDRRKAMAKPGNLNKPHP